MIFDPNDFRGKARKWVRPDPKPMKEFRHKDIESRCPHCANRGHRVGWYCLASGKAITDESGTGKCAFVPVQEPASDD